MIIPSKEFIEAFKKVDGAFSVTESIGLYNVCLEALPGLFIELGSYHGKSAMSAMQGLKDGQFIIVDPLFLDANHAATALHSINLFPHPTVKVSTSTNYSVDIIPKYDQYSYVMVDSGSHQDGLPMEEAKLLEDRMIKGGIIAWHDFGNQFREPMEAAQYLVNTGKYEWINIDWNSIIEYVKENNLEEGNNSWHIYEDRPFPTFLGAIRKN